MWGGGIADEELRRQAEAAGLLLNRIALALLDHTRRAGAFDEEEAALLSRAEGLAERLADTTALDDGVEIELRLRRDGLIELTVGIPDAVHAQATLRGDGFIESSSTRWQGESRSIRPENMEPWEREEERRRQLADEEARGKPKFHGNEYLRTVAAPPQPGAAERVLVAELYDDGLIVEFTYEPEPLSHAQMERGAATPRPPMRVEDDMGTGYYESGSASYGGSPASHARFGFAPAVPAGARALLITTDSGTVELDLQR